MLHAETVTGAERIMPIFDRLLCVPIVAVGAIAVLSGLGWGVTGLVVIGLSQVVAASLLLRRLPAPTPAGPVMTAAGRFVTRWEAPVGRIVLSGTVLLLGWMLLDDIEGNPVALFCDEVEIGFHSALLLRDGHTSLHLPFFYQHFSHNFLGALPLVGTAPFIWLLGPEDLAVRLSSVVWSAGAMILLVLLVRRIGWRFGAVGIALFAFSPVFLLMARTNFGHAPSLFCVCAGLYAWARARDGGTYRWALLAGVALGLSVYGYAGYYVATPIIVGCVALGELADRGFGILRSRAAGIVVLVLAVVWSPVVWRGFTDDGFLARYRLKAGEDSALLTLDRVSTMAENYGKYFSLDFLFRVGEIGMPGAFISRHSVPGAGVLPWVAVPLLALGVVGIVRASGSGRVFGVAAMALMILYPMPDLISTSELNAPYTFSVFTTMVCVPLLAAAGMHLATTMLDRLQAPAVAPFLALTLLAVILTGAIRFHTGPWADYPARSADYYGWQYGARESIQAFQARAYEHDQYFLDPDYCEPYIYRDFYLWEDPELREKTQYGGTERIRPDTETLYLIRRERMDRIMGSGEPLAGYARILERILYPDGSVALYVVEFNLDQQRTVPQPR